MTICGSSSISIYLLEMTLCNEDLNKRTPQLVGMRYASSRGANAMVLKVLVTRIPCRVQAL